MNKSERWAEENIMRFSKAKCKILPLAEGNPKYQYWLRHDKTESIPAEKDSEVLADENLDVS